MGAAQTLKITANGSEKIRYLAQQTAAGGYIQSATVGDYVEISWDGQEWVVTDCKGDNWTDGTVTFGILNTINKFVKPQQGTLTTLTDQATVAWAINTSQHYVLTLGGDRAIDITDTPVAGQSGDFFLVQDGTGTRDVSSWDAIIKFVDNEDPDPSEDVASAVRYFTYTVYSATWVLMEDHGVFS